MKVIKMVYLTNFYLIGRTLAAPIFNGPEKTGAPSSELKERTEDDLKENDGILVQDFVKVVENVLESGNADEVDDNFQQLLDISEAKSGDMNPSTIESHPLFSKMQKYSEKVVDCLLYDSCDSVHDQTLNDVLSNNSAETTLWQAGLTEQVDIYKTKLELKPAQCNTPISSKKINFMPVLNYSKPHASRISLFQVAFFIFYLINQSLTAEAYHSNFLSKMKIQKIQKTDLFCSLMKELSNPQYSDEPIKSRNNLLQVQNVEEKPNAFPDELEIENVQSSKESIEKEAVIEVRDLKGFTPLFWAVMSSDVAKIIDLIQKGANVNVVDSHGRTPLIYAAISRNVLVLNILLENKAKVDQKDVDGASALSHVARSFDVETAKALLDHSADINTRDTKMKTPLLYASELSNLKMSRLLIERKANVNLVGKDGFSALSYAVLSGNLQQAKLLLDHGADPNVKDASGFTPIFQAVFKKNLEMMQLLIDYKADLDKQDMRNWTPLHYAVSLKEHNLVKMLVFFRANVNIANNKGRTPIFLAAKNEDKDMIRLLARDSDLTLKDKDGYSLLRQTYEFQTRVLLKLLGAKY